MKNSPPRGSFPGSNPPRSPSDGRLDPETYLKALLDNVLAGVFLVTPNRGIRDVNRRGLFLFGYEAEELVGQSTRLLYPDEKEFLQVQNLYAKASGDTPTSLEDVPFVRKNGERIWADLSASRVRVGEEDLFVVTVLDVTERHHLQDEKQLALDERNTLIMALPDGVWLKDGNGAWRIVNPAGLALFGLSGRTDWIGKTERELARMNPPLAAAHLGCLTTDEEAWVRGSSTDATEPVVAPDGAIHLIESRKIPLFNEDGSRKSLVVIGRDVTERIRSEEVLRRYRHIFENAKEGILLMDESRKIVDVNPAFTATTGYTRDEAIGRNPNMLHSGRQDLRFYESMWASIDRDGFWEGEIWNRRKSGEAYCEWLGVTAIKKEERISGYIGIFSDITKRKEAEDRIVHMAFHDALTGLPNRRAFRERIGEVLERRSREPDLRFAVGILDLDGFKEVNDRMGHPAGDELLVQVSLRIKGVVRSTDTLSRLGGDEFGLLLVGPDLDDGIFDRIVSALSKPFDIAGERVEISGSLGATFSPPDRGEVDPLLSHASLALNRVKAREGNGWTPFQEEMEEALENRHRIRNELVRALSEKELVLHYQPQVDMVSGAVTGVEALVRWNHPERGLLFPESFINVAEKSDLISSLGRSVMEEALAQQERWKTGGLDLRVSVNIGARHFLSDNFLADLDAALSRHCRKGICPVTLEIEVTETEALKDLSKAQKIIKRCLETGIVVSLDDFGTGQASLTSLQRLSVGEIKIDKGFVGKIQDSDKDRAIVSSLVVVGRMMGIDVVAEGIETEADGLLLIGMGCRVAQGYAIAKPMPAEAVPAWIADWTPFDSWKRGATPGDPARGISGEGRK